MRWFCLVLAILVLSGMSGCLQAQRRSDVAADPPARLFSRSDRALLLGTGGIQLGHGVGKNAWRWQGDGQWGF